MPSLKEVTDALKRIKNLPEDSLEAFKYWREIHRTGDELVKAFGKGVKAAEGIDNYYHPLLQCVIAQKGSDHVKNGLALGYLKEMVDEYFDSDGKITSDNIKDLQNNRYGSILGKRNPDADCRDLLEDRRTPNMRKLGIR